MQKHLFEHSDWLFGKLVSVKTLIWALWLAQISVFVFGKSVSAKTLIWALWLAQISVFAFGKLVSAKLVSRWFYP